MRKQLGVAPTNSVDTATKSYVDSQLDGLTNLMTTNPSFVTDLTSWSQDASAWTYDGTEGHDADGSAKTVGDGTGHHLTGEIVSVVPGATYVIGCWVQASDISFGDSGYFNIGVNTFDSYTYGYYQGISGESVVTPTGTWGSLSPALASGDIDWTYLAGQFVIPLTGVNQISAQFNVQADSGDLWIDDVEIAATTTDQTWITGLAETLDTISTAISSIGDESADADSVAKRDDSGNLAATTFISTLQYLNVTSDSWSLGNNGIYCITGTGTGTVPLIFSGGFQGAVSTIINQSTKTLSVEAADNTVIELLPPGTVGVFNPLVNSPSTSTNWLAQYYGIVATSGKAVTVNNSLTLAGTDGKTLSVNNSLTLAGTDSTTMTFPGATDTVVGLGATQTLTNKTLTSPTINNPTIKGYVETAQALGTVTTAATIGAPTSGTIVTATLTASTACTFTMPSPVANTSFMMFLRQAASTGAGSAIFTGVKWNNSGAPTVTTTAEAMDIFAFVSDGTYWYGSYSQGYTY